VSSDLDFHSYTHFESHLFGNRVYTVKKTSSQNLWPQINSQVKTTQNAISKNRVERVLNFENVTLVARQIASRCHGHAE